jgi:hypothetical protein
MNVPRAAVAPNPPDVVIPTSPDIAGSPDVAAVAEQAVALDMLLVDGALWPAIRLLPTNAAMRLALEIARHPGGALRRAGELAEELGRIAKGTSELAPPPKDRRFGDQAWRTNPVLRRLLQTYQGPRRHPGRGGAAHRSLRADPIHPAHRARAHPTTGTGAHR